MPHGRKRAGHSSSAGSASGKPSDESHNSDSDSHNSAIIRRSNRTTSDHDTDGDLDVDPDEHNPVLRRRRLRRICQGPKLQPPPLDFLDLDPHIMVSNYTSITRPNPDFWADPRLRIFARALLVVCLELDTPGSIQWWLCEPIASYHRLIKLDTRALDAFDHLDHEHLVLMFHRLRGALVRRAQFLSRRDKRIAHLEEIPYFRCTPTSFVKLTSAILETALWSAPDHTPAAQTLASTKPKRVWSFLKSCAVDLRNEPLPRPVTAPTTFTDPPQVQGLWDQFKAEGVASFPPPPRSASASYAQRHSDEGRLERMPTEVDDRLDTLNVDVEQTEGETIKREDQEEPIPIEVEDSSGDEIEVVCVVGPLGGEGWERAVIVE